jgi:hypothetical protein
MALVAAALEAEVPFWAVVADCVGGHEKLRIGGHERAR